MLSSTYHDGKLTSIAVENEKLSLKVYVGNKLTNIEIGGLEKLRVTEFKEGNIINSLRVLGPSSGTGVRDLMKYAYELSDADLEQNPKFSSFLDAKFQEHQDGSILILEIEPSYGAYLVAVGREISEMDGQP